MLRYDTGDTDSGSLDRQDLIDRLVGKTLFIFRTHLIKQFDIHLMVQKTVYF